MLPHPGGGGETYVDTLATMGGYAFERVFLAAGPDPTRQRAAILRRALAVARAATAFDVLHLHGEVASTLCLPSLARRSSVVTLHGLNLLQRSGGVRRKLAGANLRLIVRAASRTICVSYAELEEVRSIAGRADSGGAVVVRNGIDPLAVLTPEERAAARSALDVPPDAVVALWVGSLEQVKDPLTAVRAAAGVADDRFVLLVAGDGALRRDVAAAASERVRLLGHRSDLRPVYGAADFFVLSSLREGLSFSLLEAMSLGLAPVVSDAPGNLEVVGDLGFVVERGDVAAFAAAFTRLVADENARTRVGAAARGHVATEFTADEMRRRTRALYDAVAANRRTRRGGGAGLPGT